MQVRQNCLRDRVRFFQWLFGDLAPVGSTLRESACHVKVNVCNRLVCWGAVVLPHCDARALVRVVYRLGCGAHADRDRCAFTVGEIQDRFSMRHRNN
ncbi:hypothetical protein A6I89_18805 [Prescottella equi]|uniref:Uncharacterized protein n=1 Tax=Rhodococcus hoagii TaxID=43767 RepID=A0AAE5IQF1_RHOHA|nr:hypothetical protein A6I89_18805 [Prescottella equi]ORL98695.1 hypothetical protein A5N73_19335 [Prescottella equi]ORM23760.1 hypothetical protein A5N68_18740 [Prescottella equi]